MKASDVVLVPSLSILNIFDVWIYLKYFFTDFENRKERGSTLLP